MKLPSSTEFEGEVGGMGRDGRSYRETAFQQCRRIGWTLEYKQESPSRTHFRLHLALYCHCVHRSDKNYPLPQSTVAGHPGSLFWIGVLPSVKLGCGLNNFRPNNNSFSLRLRPQNVQRRRDRHWQSLHFPRRLIDFRKRSIGSRKLTVQPENNTRVYYANSISVVHASIVCKALFYKS